MNTQCPSTRDGMHRYTVTIGSGIKADFEPVEYGKNAEDTLYRRVEYSLIACICSVTRKSKVIYDEDA